MKDRKDIANVPKNSSNFSINFLLKFTYLTKLCSLSDLNTKKALLYFYPCLALTWFTFFAGLATFKDTFWSTSTNPDHPFYYDCMIGEDVIDPNVPWSVSILHNVICMCLYLSHNLQCHRKIYEFSKGIYHILWYFSTK